MKQNLIIFAVAFAGALGGANVQPLLSGAGKLIFPETTPSATISASGGALTAAAGGTNQNVILTPSGSGINFSASPFHLDPGAAPANSPILLQANSLGAVALQSLGADNNQILFDAYRSGGSTLAAHATAARLAKNVGHARLQYANGLVVGGAVASFTTAWDLDLANGNGGFGGNLTPGFAVDATGDINASGVYRQGGTAGQSITVTVVKTATGQTTCTMTFTGGIKTGGTC